MVFASGVVVVVPIPAGRPVPHVPVVLDPHDLEPATGCPIVSGSNPPKGKGDGHAGCPWVVVSVFTKARQAESFRSCSTMHSKSSVCSSMNRMTASAVLVVETSKVRVTVCTVRVMLIVQTLRRRQP